MKQLSSETFVRISDTWRSDQAHAFKTNILYIVDTMLRNQNIDYNIDNNIDNSIDCLNDPL